MLAPSLELELLMPLPGVGFILATVIALEVGAVHRFSGPEHPRFLHWEGPESSTKRG